MSKIRVESIGDCIDRGTDICRVLKEQYYPNVDQKVAYRPVAEIFSTIKQIMRKIMPYTTEDALLLHLKGYSQQDLAEVYDRKGEVLCDNDLTTGSAKAIQPQ